MGLESKIVEEPSIDREKTCPLLLRVFCNTNGRHNQPQDFMRGMPSNELQIYTWLDATLKELMRLINEVYPHTKTKGTVFSFHSAWPSNRNGNLSFQMKDIGKTVIGSKGPDDNLTLKSRNFVIGDFLDVSVNIPRGGESSRGDRDRDRGGRDRGRRYR